MSFLRLLAALFILSAALPVMAQPPIKEFTARYTLSKSGLTIGESRRTLARDAGGRYVLESETWGTGLLAMFVKDRVLERSVWTYQNGGIVAQHYTYRRNGGKRTRLVEMKFDWKQNLAITTADKDSGQMPIPPGTLDKLTYQYAAQLDLQQGKREFEYRIADKGRLKTYHIVTLGEEALETPAGRFNTVKITREDDKRGTTLWCARELDYLPVRIEQTENGGDKLVAQIKSVSGLPGK